VTATLELGYMKGIMMATNSSIATAENYRERMFNLLGDRNPLDVLAQTADVLSEIVRTNSSAIRRKVDSQRDHRPSHRWRMGIRVSSEANSVRRESDDYGHATGFMGSNAPAQRTRTVRARRNLSDAKAAESERVGASFAAGFGT
jgi:hypothetical protein